MSSDELVPFYTHADLYLKPLHSLQINVELPKLSTLGSSISNWEIKERIKKLVLPHELSNLKVTESTLELVQFSAEVGSHLELKEVIKRLDDTSFRAVGFTKPLQVKATKGKLGYPTRVEWDKFFHEAKDMDEKEPGERPDTIYLSGLPTDWFNVPKEDLEETIGRIMGEYGAVRQVDVPQCDPLRKQMDPDISGIRTSTWSGMTGEEPFFEAYVQYNEYAGFVNAISVLGGKLLVRKAANGKLLEARLKIDFDRTKHLSKTKTAQRSVKRAFLEYELQERLKYNAMEEDRSKEEAQQEQARKDQELMKQLMRAEKRRQKAEQQRIEVKLRKNLEKKAKDKEKRAQKVRKDQARRLLKYIAELYRAKLKAEKSSKMTVHDIAASYAEQKDLDENDLRERILRRKEAKLRKEIAERMLRENRLPV